MPARFFWLEPLDVLIDLMHLEGLWKRAGGREVQEKPAFPL
ncbi:MAG: hypothetical protein ACKO1T_01130 [Sediminibacterium sp.]